MSKIRFFTTKKAISNIITKDIKNFLKLDKRNQVSIFPDIHLKRGEMSPTGSVFLSKKIIPSYTHLSIGSGISTWSFETEKSFDVKKFEKLFKYIQKKIPGLNTEKKKITKYNKEDIIKFCQLGARYFFKKGLIKKNLLSKIEMNGNFNITNNRQFSVYNALPDYILNKCYQNFGCLGTGNTFIELHKISENYNYKKKANKYYLFIHSGLPESYLTKFYSPRWGLHGSNFLPFERGKWNFFSRHLNNKESIGTKKNFFPYNSKYFSLDSNKYDGKLFLSGMNYLCNISTANRINHGLVIKNYLKKKFNINNFELVLDNIHDSIKKEKLNGENFFFHRHGVSPVYQNKNKNLFVIPSKPGGEIFLGRITKVKKSYHNSICHGTGRKLDRPKSVKKFTNKSSINKITKGKVKLYYKMKKISGEHPDSFNDLDEVLNLLEKKIKIKKLLKTKPIYILKS